MNQRHFIGDIGEIKRFLDSCIAAANDGDFLSTVEKTVAGRAGGNTFSLEGFLRGQAQVHGAGARRNNQGVSRINAAVAFKPERVLLKISGVDVIEDNLGIETQ